MSTDQAGSAGVMTLDPDEVETSPAVRSLDPSEVEDAPSVRQSGSAQSADSSPAEALPAPSLPAGAVGPLPGIPQANVDMRVPSLGETLTGVNPHQTPQSTYDYGQSAIPRTVQGAREVGRGQYIKGATDILGGVNQGLGSQILPIGSAPAAVAKGLAGSVAGAAAAPYVVKKLGGSPDAQALAGEIGAALPLAAGVGMDLLRSPRPEVLPPVRPGSVDVPEAGNLLTAGEPSTIDAPADAGTPSPAQPADITVHRAGKVTGIDVHTGLPLVDRTQPSEVPFRVRGEDLPPQNATAGAMSPEAEAISARAAGASQPATSQPPLSGTQPVSTEPQPGAQAYQRYQNLIDQREDELESQGTDPTKLYFSDNSEHLRDAPGWSQMPEDLENLYRLRDSAGANQLQGSIGDIQDRLSSVGIKGDEAKRILDMYALDPERTGAAQQYLAAEHAQDAAGRPWDEQVRDAYIRLADQRGIPMDDDEDLYRDKNTTRDARNAVEQVISYFHPEADRETGPRAAENPARSSEALQGSRQPVPEKAVSLSPDEVEEAPGASEADTARQNYGDFLDRVSTRAAMESHGQDILDRMQETGESPQDVSDKFWNQTYFDLPAPVQQRFTRMLKNVSGFEPGDTIAVRPDKSSIIAKDWADVAKGMLPEKAEHLEGTERGLTALMKEANDRFAQDRNSAQQASNQLQPGARPMLKQVQPARAALTASLSPMRPIVRPAQPQPAAALAKGAHVTLPDGSTGSVSYLDPAMRIARVRTSDGRNLTVRQSALKQRGALRPAGAAVRTVPTQDLTLDPKRFQYKLGTGPEGVTDLLKGKRWNDDLAGVVSVWQDPADGKTYVVNGHHRAMLAKESGTPELAVRYLKAPDAASARAIGALQNIAEGRGTPVDAAKFFRDSGLTPADLDAKGISMGEATAANGLALSRLSPQLFDDAVSGKLRQGRAIAIGKAAPEVEQQESLLKLIDRAEAKGKRVSDDTIEELGRMVRGAQTHTATQDTLFGAQEQTRNLALEKAEVSSYIRDTLSRERKLFSHVSDEGRAQQLGAAGNLIKAKTNAGIAERAGQAQELYDRLSTRVGAVNGILDRAAAKLAQGDDSNVVKREAYTATRTALAEALNGPETGRPQPVQVHPGRGSLSPAETRNGPGAVVTQVKPALPGFENAVREQSAAQAQERGHQLTNELSRPRGDIENAAGEMERNSPLFEGSEANPQSGLFRGLEERHGGFGAIDPTKLLPEAVKDYLAREADLIGKSREIHGGLYDLGEQYDADVLRANRLMKELPGIPADQEAVYHHLEEPSVRLTKTQQEIAEKLAPLAEQSEKIFRKLYPEKKQVSNYVHRIAQQKGSLLDRILGGSKSTGKGNALKTSAAAGKKRSMMAIESASGKAREVVSVARGRVTEWHDGLPRDIGPLRAGLTSSEDILDERLEALDREEKKLKDEQRTLNQTPSRQAAAGRRLQNIANRLQQIDADRASIEHEHIAEGLPGKSWRDKDGRLWTLKQATTKEIEANTPIRYYKNAAASVVTNWLELRKAERAADYIEKVKSDPGFANFGIKPKNPSQIPEGWQSTQLPQFTGYYFEPHVAEVFDHYAKQLAAGKPGVLQQVGDFLTTSIFLNPLAHIPNLTTNWLTEKGVSIANPLQWGPEFKAGVKAFNAVVHQNQDFLDALDAGAPMQSQRTAVRQFADLLVEKLQDEAKDPSVAEKLAEALGKVVNVPAAMKTVVNFMADKSTWPVHDMYFLQSAYLKMAEGQTLEQALEDTAKYIPDERLPTRIFNSKAVADVMQNPLLTMFSRYHYGVLKGYGQILKNLTSAGFEEAATNAKGEPVNKAGRTESQEKAHALNIAAGLAIMLAVVYPALDQLAVKATGNKDARVRRAGYTNFADALNRAIHGDITPLQAVRSAVTPAVVTETAIDLAANRDVFGTGRKVYDQHGNKKVIAEQVGRRLLESVSPAQLAMRASESHESAKKTLLGLIGVSFPRHGALKLAAELNADRMGDQAETPGAREKGILRSQARYSAWRGDMSAMEEAQKSGLFTAHEMAKLRAEAKLNPLLYETRGMPLDDVLKVWNRATPDERKTLLPVIVRKSPQIDTKPKAERDSLRMRLRQAITENRQQR